MKEIGKIGVVCALPIEARCLSKQPLPVGQTVALKNNILLHTAGMGPERARSAAMFLIDSGVDALISWGTAGGLAPGVTAGQLILPNQIIDQKNNIFNVNVLWRNQLQMKLGHQITVNHGLLLQAEQIVNAVAGKQHLFSQYQAVAVDMESGAVAEVANREGLPFMAIRSVVDTADVAFPEWLQSSLNSEGEIQLGSLGKKLSLHPTRLKDLIHFSGAFAAARSTLNKIADLLLTETLSPAIPVYEDTHVS